MSTTLNFKDIVSLPAWRQEAPALAVSASGVSMVSDMRNDATRHPYIYLFRSATALDFFDPTTGGWVALASPAMAGTFGAGATAVFHPSAGPRGTLAAGATTTTVALTTALPLAVANNQIANRGDGLGFVVRIVDNGAGGSGKTEEKRVIANTSGTTPTLTLESALSFTPVSGSTYEFLSGRVFLLCAGTLAAGIWKYYDILTNTMSGNLATTNLPATVSTDSSMVALSELHVPNDRTPGTGFVAGGVTYNNGTMNCIAATGTPTSTTIQGTGLTSSLFANEYANFQVRIVEDTVTPGAVGQRRRITSHTSGTTPTFTVAAFGTTPSTSAKFVIENDDDKIILKSSGVITTWNYNITANTWDTTTWGVSAGASGAGLVLEQGFGISRDPSGNARHSYTYFFRGGGVATVEYLDIATATFNSMTQYGNVGMTFTTGTSGCYDPVTLGGRFIHINVNGTQSFVRFDVRNRVLDASTYLRYTQSTANTGARMAPAYLIDGSTKLAFIYHLTHTQINLFGLTVTR